MGAGGGRTGRPLTRLLPQGENGVGGRAVRVGTRRSQVGSGGAPVLGARGAAGGARGGGGAGAGAKAFVPPGPGSSAAREARSSGESEGRGSGTAAAAAAGAPAQRRRAARWERAGGRERARVPLPLSALRGSAVEGLSLGTFRLARVAQQFQGGGRATARRNPQPLVASGRAKDGEGDAPREAVGISGQLPAAGRSRLAEGDKRPAGLCFFRDNLIRSGSAF